jgi:DNA-binding transcriptional LysR family regulator
VKEALPLSEVQKVRDAREGNREEIGHIWGRWRMNPKMNLKQLYYFEICAEERSFTRAAARVNVAQPALGRHIQTIERTLGAAVFERTAHGLELTPLGREFLREVKEFLTHYARMECQFVAHRRDASGTLTIGYDSSVADNMKLAAAIAAIKSRYPGVRLILTEMCEQRQMDMLARGELDAGVAYDICDEFATMPSLNLLHIQTDRLRLITSLNHPLAGAGEVTTAQIDGSPFVFVSREKCPKGGYDFLMRRLREIGVNLELAQEVDNVSTLVNLVAAGVGVSLVAENLREDLGRHVALLSLANLDLRFKLLVFWNKQNSNASLPLFTQGMRAEAHRSEYLQATR